MGDVRVSSPKERYRMKQLLASQENLYSNIYNSILSAMMPLLSVNTASMSLNNQVYVVDKFTLLASSHETPRRLRGIARRRILVLWTLKMMMTTTLSCKTVDI